MISSTGVVIYEHRCSHSGDHIAFYTGVEHDCDGKQVKESNKKENSSGCCKKSEKPVDEPVCKEECCSTDVSLVQIDSEYSFVESSFQFEKNNFDLNYFSDLLLETTEVSTGSNRSPPEPRISSCQKRALMQVYLI